MHIGLRRPPIWFERLRHSTLRVGSLVDLTRWRNDARLRRAGDIRDALGRGGVCYHPESIFYVSRRGRTSWEAC